MERAVLGEVAEDADAAPRFEVPDVEDDRAVGVQAVRQAEVAALRGCHGSEGRLIDAAGHDTDPAAQVGEVRGVGG